LCFPLTIPAFHNTSHPQTAQISNIFYSSNHTFSTDYHIIYLPACQSPEITNPLSLLAICDKIK
ncbi:MAG: hypothetical protein II453_21005, partial [Alphaproteobacteria bacterium]|nr:hypothetical protein [Alphaproteobacteria bacterium]